VIEELPPEMKAAILSAERGEQTIKQANFDGSIWQTQSGRCSRC